MNRLQVFVDGRLRIDEPTGQADEAALGRATDELRVCCLQQNRRLLILSRHQNVTSILVRI